MGNGEWGVGNGDSVIHEALFIHSPIRHSPFPRFV
jgi:hypothetical protein